MQHPTPSLTLCILLSICAWALVTGCSSGGGCSFNSECGAGRFCQQGTCTSECADDHMCVMLHGAGSTCSVFGQCVTADAGANVDAGPVRDAGIDAFSVDAYLADVGVADAWSTDVGASDAFVPVDAASTDASHDASTHDAGSDAYTPDSGPMLPIPLNETGDPAEADYCIIQFPSTTTTTTGVPSSAIYGQIYEAGRTDTTVGSAAPGIQAELGYGPVGTDPRTSTAWVFHVVAFNVETGPGGNNDEYDGSLTIPTSGTYAYAYRFSFDVGVHATYCDLDGAGSNAGLTFDPGNLGQITVM